MVCAISGARLGESAAWKKSAKSSPPSHRRSPRSLSLSHWRDAPSALGGSGRSRNLDVPLASSPSGRRDRGAATEGDAVIVRVISREGKGTQVLRRKRKPPPSRSSIREGCRIVEADPNVEIPWTDLGEGLWKTECACGFETYTGPLVDDRVRLDPLDPKTSRHMGECEFASETDPSVLKVLLKVRAGLGLRLAECGACGAGWQVPQSPTAFGDDARIRLEVRQPTRARMVRSQSIYAERHDIRTSGAHLFTQASISPCAARISSLSSPSTSLRPSTG